VGAESVLKEQKNRQTRARLVLVGLFALFFIPVFGAVFVAVKAPHWVPFGRINHGDLVQPPVANALRNLMPLDAGPVSKRGPSASWIIAHIGRSSCDARCEYALNQMRQARLALGKDAYRVERWWLVTHPPQTSIVTAVMQAYPGLRIGLLDASSPRAGAGMPASAVQMIDPAGFLVLRYPADWQRKEPVTEVASGLASALLKDFKRLLKISKQRR